jgi:SAM-dependent methyltransferase
LGGRPAPRLPAGHGIVLSDRPFAYEGADLESMDLAEHYHDWILGWFAPYLGKSVVEVGAGTGGFASRVAARAQPERMLLIEPSTSTAERLRRTVAAATRVPTTVHTGFLADAAPVVREVEPDTFIYVNVLEHVEHDEAELRLVYGLLRPGGCICIFVPALPSLYSDFDRSIGHFRRYTLPELSGKAVAAGFEVPLARYLDVLGILPWLLLMKWLRSTRLSPRSVVSYDRLVVPVMSRLERLVKPPLGKNVLLVARKPR